MAEKKYIDVGVCPSELLHIACKMAQDIQEYVDAGELAGSNMESSKGLLGDFNELYQQTNLSWKNNLTGNEIELAAFGKNKAPWTDLKNNDLFEGDVIVHPKGAKGTIVFDDKKADPYDAWLVDYGIGVPSRLCLQIGDKGQAIKYF